MARSKHRYAIVMAGVVPPPFHGQSLVTERIFSADLFPLEKFLVPIRSSKEIEQVGKFSLSKVFGLVPLVCRILLARFQSGSRVLYYTAGSGAWVPFFRDLFILGACRPFFKRTLIHYHSGNLVDFLKQSRVRNALGRWIYGRGAWSIRLGEGCPVPMYDGEACVRELGNGLDFPTGDFVREKSDVFRVLFLGNLYVEKGVLEVIQAVKRLAKSSDRRLRLTLVGGWPDSQTQETVTRELKDLPDHVQVTEPRALRGDEKNKVYFDNDVFVFPTYYERENLPLVVIEAMAAGLPVVATRWRGLSNLVVHGQTGFLVPPRDEQELFEAILHLMESPEARETMGSAGRLRYEERFTSEKFLEQTRALLLEAVEPA